MRTVCAASSIFRTHITRTAPTIRHGCYVAQAPSVSPKHSLIPLMARRDSARCRRFSIARSCRWIWSCRFSRDVLHLPRKAMDIAVRSRYTPDPYRQFHETTSRLQMSFCPSCVMSLVTCGSELLKHCFEHPFPSSTCSRRSASLTVLARLGRIGCVK